MAETYRKPAAAWAADTAAACSGTRSALSTIEIQLAPSPYRYYSEILTSDSCILSSVSFLDRLELFLQQLLLVQIRVISPAAQQLRMRTLIHQLALLQHENLARIANR